MSDDLLDDQWAFEKKVRQKGFSIIAGIDEAGRGPLAGPVVSAAVILPDIFPVSDITDSKKLTPKKRDDLYHRIYNHALSVGIGRVEPDEIDRINILQAALRSMAMAVKDLSIRPDYLLIDGKFPIPSDLPQEPVVKGDALSISIGAASIIAKVVRDQIMDAFHRQYPEYGFANHKGYPTKAHRAAIQKYGPCPIHRRTFKGVREYVE